MTQERSEPDGNGVSVVVKVRVDWYIHNLQPSLIWKGYIRAREVPALHARRVRTR